MKRLTLVVLSAAVVLAVQAHGQDGKAPQADMKEVRELMKKAHRGKDSPFQRLTGGKSMGLNPSPDLSWEEIGQASGSLAVVRDGLLKTRNPGGEHYYSWPWGVDAYVKGLKELEAAVKVQDRPAADKAVGHLSLSCVQCHHYYSPGFGG